MADTVTAPGPMLDRLRRVRSLSRSLPAETPPRNGAATISLEAAPVGAPTESYFLGLDESPDPGLDTTPHDRTRTPADVSVNNHIIGPYHLQTVLGRGGMGIVFKARDTRLHRTVALKMLLGGGATDERIASRFTTEAQALARLDHANVVPVFDVNEWEGLPYFVMKYVPGGTLADAAERLRGDTKALVTILAKVCRAVGYLHEMNVSHRDLKPLNILLSEDDEPLVADFGLAKLHDTDSSVTVTHCLLGTRFYMAPEQTRGSQLNLTPACDIWSLGVILYEVVSSRLPFKADNQSELFDLICKQTPADLTLPDGTAEPQLNAVVHKALAKQPEERYATATALAEDLERWLAGDAVVAPPPPRKKLWRYVAIAAAVVGIGIALALALQEKQSPQVLIGETGEGVTFDPFAESEPITGRDDKNRFTLDAKTDIAFVQLADKMYPSGIVFEAKVKQLESPRDHSFAGIYCCGTILPGPKGRNLYCATVRADGIASPNANPAQFADSGPGVYFHAARWDPSQKQTFNPLPIGRPQPVDRIVPSKNQSATTVSIRIEIDPNGTITPFIDGENPLKPLTRPDLIKSWDLVSKRDVPPATVPAQPGHGIGLVVERCKAAFWDVKIRPR